MMSKVCRSDLSDVLRRIAAVEHPLLLLPAREARCLAKHDSHDLLGHRLGEVDGDIGELGVEPLRRTAISDAPGDNPSTSSDEKTGPT